MTILFSQQSTTLDSNSSGLSFNTGHGTIGYGATGQGATGYGATGQGTTGHGAIGQGATGQGTIGYGAIGQGTIGYGATGQGIIGYGATGQGTTGHGITYHSNISNTTYTASQYIEIQRAGYERYKDEKQKDIVRRFYDYLFKIFEEENDSLQKSLNFFELSSQIEKDPASYLNPTEYFIHALSYFYINTDEKQKSLWLRSKTNLYEIKLSNHSGSLYQSPYDYDTGMLYIGFSETEGHCFSTEKSKGVIFMSPYYFDRSFRLHHISSSIIKSIDSVVIEMKPSNELYKHILDGKLSDDEIKCQDGTVKISKSILASHSSYFLFLFTNDSFKKQESYKLDFPKKTVEYYIGYCCNIDPSFEPELTIDMIQFGDFIQDKKFLQYYYSKIYLYQEKFTTKSLLEIMKIYQTMGF